ncbi:MAG: 6-bladed beta-propeller [Mediterranea sp.]|jgi:hypothetical protein|nr:6-bladed beta-propeller [Mediterranea sp.]
MKASSTLFVYLIALCLPSCQGSKTDDALETLRIAENERVDNIDASDYFHSVRVIPLETSDETLIDDKSIAKIVHAGAHVYVADRYALYKFDEQGCIRGKIDRRGNGPDEYPGISDFEIADENSVWILSRDKRTLYLYTWDGEMRKSIPLDCWAAKARLLAPNRMCLYIGNEMDAENTHQLRVIDLDTGQTVSALLKIDPNKAKFLHVSALNHFLKRTDNECYYYNIFDDYIYLLTEKDIRPVYELNILNKNIPAALYQNEYENVAYFFQEVLAHDYAYGVNLFLDGPGNMAISYYHDGVCRIAMVSKESHRSVVDFHQITVPLLENYVIGEFPENMFGSGDELILPLQPFDIMDAFQDDLDKQERIKRTINYIGDEQNPLLLLMKVK